MEDFSATPATTSTIEALRSFSPMLKLVSYPVRPLVTVTFLVLPPRKISRISFAERERFQTRVSSRAPLKCCEPISLPIVRSDVVEVIDPSMVPCVRFTPSI